jgi:hypothetical protein
MLGHVAEGPPPAHLLPILLCEDNTEELFNYGQLEAVYRIRLSFPLLAHAVNQQPAVIKFADTNNLVSIEYPKPGPDQKNSWKNLTK